MTDFANFVRYATGADECETRIEDALAHIRAASELLSVGMTLQALAHIHSAESTLRPSASNPTAQGVTDRAIDDGREMAQREIEAERLRQRGRS